MTAVSEPIRILGIGGSTRRGSMSLVALTAALRLAKEQGAHTSLAAVRDLDLPLYTASGSYKITPRHCTGSSTKCARRMAS